MHPAADGLFYGLENDFSSYLKGSKKRIGFMRAELHPNLKTILGKKTLYLSQSFKPDFDKLVAAGFKPSPTFKTKSPVDVMIYLPTRNREENKFMLAKSIEGLKEGGVLITAQHNTLGASHLEKDLKALVPNLTTISKKHCRVMAAVKSQAPDDLQLSLYQACGNPEHIQNTSMCASPGVFSWKKPDTGSLMLMDMIEQEDLAGRGADFGAGWGFLSQRALKMSTRIREINLYEAELRALNCAEQNIKSFLKKLSVKKTIPKVNFHWLDVIHEDFEPQFDFILCNPPQHNLNQTDQSLALRFMEKCAHALKPEGVLWLVTNHHIPAERILTKLFQDVEEKNNDRQFKVFRAIKAR